MNAITTYHGSNEKIQAYREKIKLVAALTVTPFNILQIYWISIDMVRECKSIRQSYINSIERCKQGCDDASACAMNFCKTAKEIRDSLYKLRERYLNTSLLRPLGLVMAGSVDSWDDFVVDCEIASDKEVQNLIEKIADAA